MLALNRLSRLATWVVVRIWSSSLAFFSWSVPLALALMVFLDLPPAFVSLGLGSLSYVCLWCRIPADTPRRCSGCRALAPESLRPNCRLAAQAASLLRPVFSGPQAAVQLSLSLFDCLSVSRHCLVRLPS
jgi:hypothetical protein